MVSLWCFFPGPIHVQCPQLHFWFKHFQQSLGFEDSSLALEKYLRVAQLHAMAYRDAVNLNLDADSGVLQESVLDGEQTEQVAIEKKPRRSGKSGKSGKPGRSNWGRQKKPQADDAKGAEAVVAEVPSCQEQDAAAVPLKRRRVIQRATRVEEEEEEDEIRAPVEKVDKAVQTLTLRTPWNVIELGLCEWQEMQERGIAKSPHFFFPADFPQAQGEEPECYGVKLERPSY